MTDKSFTLPTHFRSLLVFAGCLCLPVILQAQSKDTLALIKQFIQAGSSYKKLPLYLEIEQQNSTNFIISEEDTTHTKGTFYLLPGISYVRFGDIEQIVNDSMALLVSDKMQHMVLFADARPVLMQLKALTGPAWQDTSAVQVAARFTVQAITSGENRSALLLSGKRLLMNTALPRESMELYYDTRTNQPVKIITIKRTLVPLEANDYKMLQSNAEMAGKLVNKEDSAYYLIKEQVSHFIYRQIRHDTAMKIPVTLSDRIGRNSEGKFQPVKNYEHYQLSINE
jgi:hypothetical protein